MYYQIWDAPRNNLMLFCFNFWRPLLFFFFAHLIQCLYSSIKTEQSPVVNVSKWDKNSKLFCSEMYEYCQLRSNHSVLYLSIHFQCILHYPCNWRHISRTWLQLVLSMASEHWKEGFDRFTLFIFWQRLIHRGDSGAMPPFGTKVPHELALHFSPKCPNFCQ